MSGVAAAALGATVDALHGFHGLWQSSCNNGQTDRQHQTRMQADEILNPDDYGSPAAYVRLGGRGTVDGSAEVGSDAKPFVLDDGLIRTLHFTTAFVQSEMNIGQPDMLI